VVILLHEVATTSFLYSSVPFFSLLYQRGEKRRGDVLGHEKQSKEEQCSAVQGRERREEKG
jgi:hypothetical protein